MASCAAVGHRGAHPVLVRAAPNRLVLRRIAQRLWGALAIGGARGPGTLVVRHPVRVAGPVQLDAGAGLVGELDVRDARGDLGGGDGRELRGLQRLVLRQPHERGSEGRDVFVTGHTIGAHVGHDRGDGRDGVAVAADRVLEPVEVEALARGPVERKVSSSELDRVFFGPDRGRQRGAITFGVLQLLLLKRSLETAAHSIVGYLRHAALAGATRTVDGAL